MEYRVSVLLPVKNEEEYIEECINSLLNQTYSENKYEIIVVDGMSDDKTREIVREIAKESNVKLISNPDVDVAHGYNKGIEESKGDYLLFFEGHSYAEENLIESLVKKLDEYGSDIAGVGCPHKNPDSDSIFSKAVGAVTSSLFGGGNTSFRDVSEEKEVKSIAHTMYRRKALKDVNYVDTKFANAGEDADLNIRLKKKGYKLIITPKTKAYHHKKDSFESFAGWIFNYGVARANLIKEHRLANNFIYFYPFFILVSALFLFSLGVTTNNYKVIILPFFIYTIIDLIFSVKISYEYSNIKLGMYSFILYPMLHTLYCLGYFYKLVC